MAGCCSLMDSVFSMLPTCLFGGETNRCLHGNMLSLMTAHIAAVI